MHFYVATRQKSDLQSIIGSDQSIIGSDHVSKAIHTTMIRTVLSFTTKTNQAQLARKYKNEWMDSVAGHQFYRDFWLHICLFHSLYTCTSYELEEQCHYCSDARSIVTRSYTGNKRVLQHTHSKGMPSTQVNHSLITFADCS